MGISEQTHDVASRYLNSVTETPQKDMYTADRGKVTVARHDNPWISINTNISVRTQFQKQPVELSNEQKTCFCTTNTTFSRKSLPRGIKQLAVDTVKLPIALFFHLVPL
jgi:hypothetical protein